MFKELFKKLYDASDEEKSKSPIWSAFRTENLTLSSLKEILVETACKNDILSKFENINSNCNLFDAFNEEDDKLWQDLFLILRDMGCKDLHIKKDQVISVLCAGEARDVNFADLDSNILSDYGDILNAQTAIPETVLFEDDKKMLMDSLKKDFESMTNGKTEEETKAILSQVKQSSDAKYIKDIQSLEAEVFVQTKLVELGKEENVTMGVFRGIKTYGYIGHFLERFGIKCSKLRYVSIQILLIIIIEGFIFTVI